MITLKQIRNKINRDRCQIGKQINTRNLYWYNAGMENVMSIIKECINEGSNKLKENKELKKLKINDYMLTSENVKIMVVMDKLNEIIDIIDELRKH